MLKANAKSARSVSPFWEEKSLISSPSPATHGGVPPGKILHLPASVSSSVTQGELSSWKVALKPIGTKHVKHLSRYLVHHVSHERQPWS